MSSTFLILACSSTATTWIIPCCSNIHCLWITRDGITAEITPPTAGRLQVRFPTRPIIMISCDMKCPRWISSRRVRCTVSVYGICRLHAPFVVRISKSTTTGGASVFHFIPFTISLDSLSTCFIIAGPMDSAVTTGNYRCCCCKERNRGADQPTRSCSAVFWHIYLILVDFRSYNLTLLPSFNADPKSRRSNGYHHHKANHEFGLPSRRFRG